MRDSTRLVAFDPCDGDPFHASTTPIYQTATFDQESAAAFGRFDYSRSGNPTREVLERQVASLERGVRAFAFASGLAAIDAVLELLAPGDEILACDDLYGGTYRLFSRVAARRGIVTRYADLTDPEVARSALLPRTKLVYIESVSNPLMRVCDIRALAALSQRHGALLAVDNTFLSPLGMRPLELGADLVIHSATKYLCGHGDVTAGTLAVRDETLASQLAFLHNATGVALAPHDCALLLRGLKTLDLRLERQQRSAGVIARHLLERSEVRTVRFPGLPGFPSSYVHKRQAAGDGAVVCIETGDAETSRRFVEALRLFPIRVSFGSVGSSASMPCAMSHASIPDEVRKARNFPSDIVRLSVGIEDVRDLIADIDAAFASLRPHASTHVEVKPSPGTSPCH